MFTNEPANCKWDKTDTSYDTMTNSFTCTNGIDEVQQNGLWLCEDDLTGLQQGENTFYFRCRDMPLDGGESNTNSQSYVYTLNVADELVITSLQPEGEVNLRNAELLVGLIIRHSASTV